MKSHNPLHISDFCNRLISFKDKLCLIDAANRRFSYEEFLATCKRWEILLKRCGVLSGEVIALSADYDLYSLSFLVAAWKNLNIVALIPSSITMHDNCIQESKAAWTLELDEQSLKKPNPVASQAKHPVLQKLSKNNESGFIIFTSGSSGKPKAVVHQTSRFLGKFHYSGKSYRTLALLVFDHIAGIDTVFYTFAAGGALIIPAQRNPETVCATIESHQIEVLPTSPSFLRLILTSKSHVKHDLSSLKIITYGSEPIDELTLKRLADELPRVKLIQKYGTTELGSPRAISRDRRSRWICLKSDEVEIKVINDILWIRSPNSMLGYLNYPSPFDSEGWMCTGDVVEQNGNWIKINGRQSDVINVGGEKVVPAEVEEIISELDFVLEAVVYGEEHALLGKIIKAQVRLTEGEGSTDTEKKIRKHCLSKLPRYKVPMEIRFVTEPLHTDRQKKTRAQSS